MKKVWQMLHILRRCGAWYFVQISRLGKLCNCSKSSGKKEEHLGVLFKSRANPNVSASLRGNAEMHLSSDSRKRDGRAGKLKLRHEDSTRSSRIDKDVMRCRAEFKSASVTACDISLQIPGFWVRRRGFVPLLRQLLRSPNKIYIWVPNTYGYSLQKTRSNSVDSLGRYSRFVSDFALPWQR